MVLEHILDSSDYSFLIYLLYFYFDMYLLISRLFEQKNERTSQIKLINIIKQLK